MMAVPPAGSWRKTTCPWIPAPPTGCKGATTTGGVTTAAWAGANGSAAQSRGARASRSQRRCIGASSDRRRRVHREYVAGGSVDVSGVQGASERYIGRHVTVTKAAFLD